MFHLVRKVGLYDRIPILYSSAWHDWLTSKDVCFPVGLHWLARWLRAFWIWTLTPSAKEREERCAYHMGYQNGFSAGRKAMFAEVVEKFGGPN